MSHIYTWYYESIWGNVWKCDMWYRRHITAAICSAVVWLRVLVCQACINIPQTMTVVFMSQPFFSPQSCLGSQQYLQVKIPMGGYLIFHPVFHLQIIGYPGSQQVITLFSFLSAAFYWFSLSLYLTFWFYPNSIQKQVVITSLGTITESLKCPFGKSTQACILFTFLEETLQLMWLLGDSTPHGKQGMVLE